MPVKSPCNGTCMLDPRSGYCMGCYRTGDEIGSWMTMSDGTKNALFPRPANAAPNSKTRPLQAVQTDPAERTDANCASP